MRGRGVVALLTLLSFPASAWAGAWTLPDGTGQWLASLGLATSSEYFDHGSLLSTPRYNKAEPALLIEYGLTDRLTAIVNPGLQHIDIAAPTSAERTGIGYTELGARYAFFRDADSVVSVQATLRLPGTTDTTNPAAIGYTDVETDVRLLFGRTLQISGMPAFIDIEPAERIRTAGYPNEFRLDATLGVEVAPRWTVLAQSFNVFSEGGGTSIFGGSYDYEKLQLSAVYALTPAWSLQGGGYTTYAGQNALQENGLLFAVWHKF